MKPIWKILSLASIMLISHQPTIAGDHKHSGLKIDQPWSRATPGDARVGAAYLKIHNMGHELDRLISVSSSAAEKAEMHTHGTVNGMMSMVQLETLDLPPGEVTLFKPGEHHIMLLKLKQPLVEGDNFTLTLDFEKAEDITITVPVSGIGAMSAATDMKHMDHSEHKME